MSFGKASLRLLLVRHGEAEGNAEGVMIGQTDVSLTPHGIEQAHRTGSALASSAIAQIYSSPLRRARETAAEIAGRTGARVELVDDLREMNIGEAHGLRWAEIAELWPEFARGYADEALGMTVPWPDGESGMELYARVARAIDQIVSRHLTALQADPANKERVVAVVGHGGSLAWAIHHLLKRSPTRWPRYGIPNASISEFLVRSRDEPAELHRLNDVSHLQALSGEPLPNLRRI